MKRLLDAREAGEYLGLSEQSVRQRVHRGDLPHVKIGRRLRFDIRDLERLVERSKVPARSA